MGPSNIQQNRRILLVDDNSDIHLDFQKILAPQSENGGGLHAARAAFLQQSAPSVNSVGYELNSAYQGEEAISMVSASIAAGQPYAMAFVDSRMPPGLDGIETIRRIWEVDSRLLVVICTAFSDYTWEQIAERLNHPSGFFVLKKPFDTVEVRQLAAALTTQWSLQRAVEAHTREIVATRDLTMFALADLAESRDPETGDHLRRMRTYSQVLALELQKRGPYREQINEQFLADLFRASPLHDIGKVGVPDAILLKPTPLTDDEFQVMKTHTVIGAETLRRAMQKSNYGGFLKMAVAVARWHHERFDGTGYPDGLRGVAIPLAARIVSVADVYDALTSTRVYKDAIAPEVARETIVAAAGTQFDPAIVEAFEACFDELARVPYGNVDEWLPSESMPDALVGAS